MVSEGTMGTSQEVRPRELVARPLHQQAMSLYTELQAFLPRLLHDLEGCTCDQGVMINSAGGS